MYDRNAAAHETSGDTLTYVFYELSRRPDLQDRLREELNTLLPPVTFPGAPDELPGPKSVDQLTLGLVRVHSKTITSSLRVSPPPRPLNDPASVPIEFYFKETSQLFSCYDSSMNPFRTTVSRLWDSSPLLYTTLKSMAAASLVDDFPHLGALLAMLMLGGSAGWHDPTDLGLPFFNRIRRKLASVQTGSFERHDADSHFFHQATTYWEMLPSYVAESDDPDSSDNMALAVVGRGVSLYLVDPAISHLSDLLERRLVRERLFSPAEGDSGEVEMNFQ
ncbi:hypothetical protein ACJ41O_009040 [Fusarium nematophilum]